MPAAHILPMMEPAAVAGMVAVWAVLTGGLILAGFSISRERKRYAALRKPKKDEVWVEINPRWTKAERVLVCEVSRDGKQLWYCGRSDNFQATMEQRQKIPAICQPSDIADTRDFVAEYRFEKMDEPWVRL